MEKLTKKIQSLQNINNFKKWHVFHEGVHSNGLLVFEALKKNMPLKLLCNEVRKRSINMNKKNCYDENYFQFLHFRVFFCPTNFDSL